MALDNPNELPMPAQLEVPNDLGEFLDQQRQEAAQDFVALRVAMQWLMDDHRFKDHRGDYSFKHGGAGLVTRVMVVLDSSKSGFDRANRVIVNDRISTQQYYAPRWLHIQDFVLDQDEDRIARKSSWHKYPMQEGVWSDNLTNPPFIRGIGAPFAVSEGPAYEPPFAKADKPTQTGIATYDVAQAAAHMLAVVTSVNDTGRFQPE